MGNEPYITGIGTGTGTVNFVFGTGNAIKNHCTIPVTALF